MRFLLPVLLVLPAVGWAGVHMQNPQEVIDPSIISPTHINTLPAAVSVTAPVLRGQPELMALPPVSGTVAVSKAVVVSTSAVSPTALAPSIVAGQQCVNGLQILTQLSLVGYDANPNRAFMRVAASAAIAQPYAANGVPPNLKGLQSAIDDLPFNGAGVKEINQAYGITRTACAGIVKPK